MGKWREQLGLGWKMKKVEGDGGGGSKGVLLFEGVHAVSWLVIREKLVDTVDSRVNAR